MISYHIYHTYYMILSYDMILENFRRTDREQRTEKKEFKPEATLIPVDLKYYRNSYKLPLLMVISVYLNIPCLGPIIVP